MTRRRRLARWRRVLQDTLWIFTTGCRDTERLRLDITISRSLLKELNEEQTVDILVQNVEVHVRKALRSRMGLNVPA